MDIIFRSNSLASSCNSWNKAVRKYGRETALLVIKRLDQIRAAANLADLMKLPGARCHQLKGDRKDQFAVDLVHPYRLIFTPADNPEPRKDDGGIDLTRVRSVTIIQVKEDYHDGK